MNEKEQEIAQEPLSNSLFRQRFWVWSVAVASSMTTSGLVNLRPSSVWAQEDRTAANQEADASAASEAALTTAKFNQLLNAQKYDEAAAMIDRALEQKDKPPMLETLDSTLSMRMLRSNQELAVERLTAQMARLQQADELSMSDANQLATSAYYLTMANDELPTGEKLSILDKALNRLQAESGDRLKPIIMRTLSHKARLLVSADRAEEAKELLEPRLSEAREAIDPEQPLTLREFTQAAMVYTSVLRGAFSDTADQVHDEAVEVAQRLLETDSPQPTDFDALLNLKRGQAQQLMYSDPQRSMKVLEELQQQLDSFREKLDEVQQPRLAQYERLIESIIDRVKPALEREMLVGQSAPEIDAKYFVGREPVSMDDLKGKVVLLDFWAVWCGPCIATFPHLREWHEEFADDGLVILGATKFYGYAWDEEDGRAARGEDEVSDEEELAMLEKFREAYDLHHGFMVSGPDSNYSQQFKVTGIPQAVLIDQEGKIRMIKVGSGEENAKALDGMIRELLQ